MAKFIVQLKLGPLGITVRDMVSVSFLSLVFMVSVVFIVMSAAERTVRTKLVLCF